MPKRVTRAEFIERAESIHGDRYKYSQVEYKGIHRHVTIVCPEHGQFQQSPANHYAGKGCSECGGSKPHTNGSFIEAAQKVHGDRYCYSLVEYSMNKAPITIICNLHGVFSQTAAVHLRGNGCPECGGNKKHTRGSFIAKAQNVHGDRYDYSYVDYMNAHVEVTIVCSEHGAFMQSPSNHFAGKGCPDCGLLAASEVRRKTTEHFIDGARTIHGRRYDYSFVEYVASDEKVTIICSEHGPFKQTPSQHLVGSGCSKCGILAAAEARRKSTDEFIANSVAIHGDRFDYSLVDYVIGKEKVTFICPDHGPFEQTPNGHLAGKGCNACGIAASSDAKRSNKEEFITKASEVHGDLYDYSLVKYVASNKKVEIICTHHGRFLQTPGDHINQGSGCPDCAETGFNPTKPSLLYYVAITSGDGNTVYKIGITNHSIEKRFPAADLARIRIVKIWPFAEGSAAAERERQILFQYAGDRYLGPRLLVGAGNTELFTHDILGLDDGGLPHTQVAVDESARLISRQIQSRFDF